MKYLQIAFILTVFAFAVAAFHFGGIWLIESLHQFDGIDQ